MELVARSSTRYSNEARAAFTRRAGISRAWTPSFVSIHSASARSSSTSRAPMTRAAAAQAKDVTLLINNAGALSLGRLADIPVDAVRGDMETNFFGLLNVITPFVPILERNHGSIVNILSLLSLASMPGVASYNASKAAGWSLTLSFRADLAKRGIRMHAVFPGAVDTEMARSFEIPKPPAIDVARTTLAGVAADQEDIYPDSMAQQVYAAWRTDHKAVERQFAAM